MKIVCDTNILISGILFGGKPRKISRLYSSRTVANCISPVILKEVEEVLLRPKFDLKEELGIRNHPIVQRYLHARQP